MKRNRGRSAAVVLLAVLFTAVACTDGIEMVGDAMVDAGEMLGDAGERLSDAGDAMTPDASAQVTMTANCDVVREYTQRFESGDTWSESTVTYWYAEARFDEATASGASEVGGTLCGYENFATATSPCPDSPGFTCTGDFPYPEMDCVGTVPSFEDGLVRVYCGFRSSTVSSTDSTPTISGSRRTTARLFAR